MSLATFLLLDWIMNWKHPLVEFVEAIVALWLFDIFFKPRKNNEVPLGN